MSCAHARVLTCWKCWASLIRDYSNSVILIPELENMKWPVFGYFPMNSLESASHSHDSFVFLRALGIVVAICTEWWVRMSLQLPLLLAFAVSSGIETLNGDEFRTFQPLKFRESISSLR